MFIVWRGYGIVVPLVVVAAFFLLIIISESLGLPATLMFVLNGLLPGAFLWWFGRKVNDPSKDQLLQDVQTGEMVRLTKRHDFFWIKIEHWAIVLLVAAAIVAVLGGFEAFRALS